MIMDPTSSTAVRDGAARLVDFKSVTVTLAALVLRTTDPDVLSVALSSRFSGETTLLDIEPVVIDLSQVRDVPVAVDFAALVATLRRHGLQPIAVRRGTEPQMRAAEAIGLAPLEAGAPPWVAASAPIPLDALPAGLTPARPGADPRVVLTEVIGEAERLGSAIEAR